MCLTADDTSAIKVWDIRSLKCIQTIEISSKARINRLLSLIDHGKICFVSNRVNLLEFDDKDELKKKFNL